MGARDTAAGRKQTPLALAPFETAPGLEVLASGLKAFGLEGMPPGYSSFVGLSTIDPTLSLARCLLLPEGSTRLQVIHHKLRS